MGFKRRKGKDSWRVKRVRTSFGLNKLSLVAGLLLFEECAQVVGFVIFG